MDLCGSEACSQQPLLGVTAVVCVAQEVRACCARVQPHSCNLSEKHAGQLDLLELRERGERTAQASVRARSVSVFSSVAEAIETKAIRLMLRM